MEYFHSLVRPENRIFALTYNFALSDPIYSGVLIEQLEYVKDLEHRPRMILSTNGSGRSVAWWENLASLLTSRDIVEFSIDGLQDTNSIYRVNAKWDSIIEGIKTTIPFHQKLMEDPKFNEGDFTTAFMDTFEF